MIYTRELQRNLRGLFVWTATLGGFIFMMLAIFPQLAADQAAINEMIHAYPDSLKNVFQMETLNFSTIIGFYGLEIYMFTTLLGSVYAVLLAGNIIAKEENSKTIEFLLSKPISRSQILKQKAYAVLSHIALFNTGLAVISVLGFQFTKNQTVDYSLFLSLVFGAFILHLSMASIAFLLSAIVRRGRNMISIALGIVFFSYALNIASNLNDTFKGLGNISLFHYVNASDIISQKHLNYTHLLIMGLLICVMIGATFMYYQRKDITV